MMFLDSLFILLSTFSTLFSVLVDGRLVNITVDDTTPDPLTGEMFMYFPTSDWNAGNGCQACTAKLDPSLTYDATWHDATFDDPLVAPAEEGVQTASLQFNGSAFYAYGVISHSITSPRSTSNLSFFIDGQLTGTFTYVPPNPGQSTYTYNALLYANNSIPPGPHSFVLQNGNAGSNVSLVLFDYAVYTREDDTTTVTSDTATATSDMTAVTYVPASTQSEGSLHSTTAASPPVLPKHSLGSNRRMIIIACVVPLTLAFIVTVLSLIYIRRRRRRLVRGQDTSSSVETWSAPEAPAAENLAVGGSFPITGAHYEDGIDSGASFPVPIISTTYSERQKQPTNPSQPSPCPTESQLMSTGANTNEVVCSEPQQMMQDESYIPQYASQYEDDDSGDPPPAYDTLSVPSQEMVE